MSKKVEKVSKANSVDENFDDYLSCEDDEFMTKTMKVIFDFSLKLVIHHRLLIKLLSFSLFYFHINIRLNFFLINFILLLNFIKYKLLICWQTYFCYILHSDQ